MSYGFAVGIIPTKRRVRFRRNGGTYTDSRTYAEMSTVRDAYDGPMFTGPLYVQIDVYGCLPKSAPKRMKSRPATHKPDADNIAKCCLDALNGVAWKDDAQVVELRIRKHPDMRRSAPLTYITITEVDDAAQQ